MDVTSSLALNATIISNEFIDRYMTTANGEYIKEYLYILRHQGSPISAAMIADALNHTEADVSRALSYWKKAGVLADSGVPVPGGGENVSANKESACAKSSPKEPEMDSPVPVKAEARSVYTPEQMMHLSGDEDFSQLLYIAQKYMNKVFTQRECEVFAYLYDGISMASELLEYLVEYCVQGGHSSIRYIETVALSWHEKGFRTVDEAKTFTSSFTKDSFAVMRAFGLNDRKPGDSEREMIERWFRSYGFTKELVLEACNRTMEATHSPSFKYADKILSGWKQSGVRSLKDVKLLDEKRAGAVKEKSQEGKTQTSSKSRTGQNQFQNFPQRDIDYDSLVLDQLTNQ